MKKLVDTYKLKDLEEIDKRIIKGIFLRKNRDFDEELIMKQQTLYEKLLTKTKKLTK
jgi:hypothetical protein